MAERVVLLRVSGVDLSISLDSVCYGSQSMEPGAVLFGKLLMESSVATLRLTPCLMEG